MKNIKEITQRDYSKRMDKVLDYIQENLDDDLSLIKLSSLACFSQYHFHRIFTGMVGESVKAYVRRLRLERAALKLKMTQSDITSIAFDSCFETHESFSRAFKGMFGVSPTEYRLENRFTIKRKHKIYWKETTMKAKIVTMEDMDVVYVRHIGPYINCGVAWSTLCEWAGPQGLLQPGVKMMGLSYDDPQVTPEDKLRYDACIEVKNIKELGVLNSPMTSKHINAGKYARTTHLGPYDTLTKTYSELCGQWLPQNGYEIESLPCIEIYLNTPEDTEPEDLITDIYIPIVG
jgi:AraC family transcriptional regulator